MQISGEAIVIKLQPFSDEKLLCTVLFEEHGLYKGIVKINAKMRSQIQVGNIVSLSWSARLAEHLGSLYGELIKPLSMQILNDRLKLTAINSVSSLIADCLPEKLPETLIYNLTKDFIANLRENSDWIKDYLFYELRFLDALGYGLSLDKCIVSGKTENLHYVSPKTGMAVTREIGEEYHNKLLLIPKFYLYESSPIFEDIIAAFKLNGFFLNKHLYQIRDMKLPVAREKLFSLVEKN